MGKLFNSSRGLLLVLLGGWLLVMLFLFNSEPQYHAWVQFSNDCPLGMVNHDYTSGQWGTLDEIWNDLNWLGSECLPNMPDVTWALKVLCGTGIVNLIIWLGFLAVVGFCWKRTSWKEI